LWNSGTGVFMAGSRIPASFGIFLLSAAVFVCLTAPSSGTNFTQDPTSKQAGQANAEIPRGMKLMLKDGTYQVVREYKRDGERVRYFSMERGDWEEIPASMVDWDATAKEAEAAQKSSAETVAKIHKQEEGKRMDNVMDVDASLQVGGGVFLPMGEGMFLVEGKSVRLLLQVDSHLKTDKTRAIEQVLSPVPIVPGKKHMEIPGTHATLRLRSQSPEFYLREAPPDPEQVSRIKKSSRPEEGAGPDVELLRAKVTHGGRQFETISSLFGEEMSRDRSALAIQRWEVAPTVYRFTLGEPLPPGEYVLAEVTEDGLNMYVWDFGVDEAAGASGKK
jgi:hypothetical protein